MKLNDQRNTIIYCLLIPILLSGRMLWAQSEDGGQAGAFLRNGVSSRALSMGGAFTALADDPSAGYWNPAGLGQLKFPELIGTYSILSLDRKYNYFAFGFPLMQYGSIGIGWVNFGVDGIEGRDLAGGITGMLTNADNAYYLTYAYQVKPNLSIGLSFKYLLHHLAGYQSTGTGFDIGLLFTPTPGINLGLNVQDLSTTMTWDTENQTEEVFPRTVRAGICFTPFQKNIHLTMDYVAVQNMDGLFHGGVEIPLFSSLGVRAGYDGSRLVGGAYFSVPVDPLVCDLDYCFGKDAIDQTYAHKVSIRLRFVEYGPKAKPSDPMVTHEPDGQLELLSSKFDARIAKLVVQYPNYALINLGLEHGLVKGTTFNVYRNVNNSSADGSIVVHVGVVEVVRVNPKMSAVRVVTLTEGYLLNVGDFLFRKFGDSK